MHTNNKKGAHGPTNREIDAKVLALRAAIAEDQIRRQQNNANNNGNNTLGNQQHHANLIPSHSFNQRMDMMHQQRQQATHYFTGQAAYHPPPPLNGQNPYHHQYQHLSNTQPSPQPLEVSNLPEDIFVPFMDVDQLNRILENGDKVISMSSQIMPLIDSQASAQLFGIATGSNMQGFVPSPPPSLPTISPLKPQSLLKAPSHKRSASAITTHYHPTLMEEMEHPNTTNSFMTPPGTPMHQNNPQSPVVRGKLPLPKLQVSTKQVQKTKENVGSGGSDSNSRRGSHLTYHPIAPHPNGSEMGIMRAAPIVTMSAFPKVRRRSSSAASNQTTKQCSNCGDMNTSQWRHDSDKHILCNPCGLYLRNHGIQRDVSKILAKKGELTLTELCRRTKEAVLVGGEQARKDLERDLMRLEDTELLDMVHTLEVCLQIAQRCSYIKNKEIQQFTH